MVPASRTEPDFGREPAPLVSPALSTRVRLGVFGVVTGLIVLFAVAAWLNPYEPDGRPRAMGTHKQLGLPECNFVRLTGLPCPSCGMTTSFALLMHGDLGNSLRANPVGTLLAVCLLAAIPWSVAGAVRGRWLWIRTLEPVLLKGVIVLTTLAVARWVVMLAMRRWGSG
jgi:hypothetical protein